MAELPCFNNAAAESSCALLKEEIGTRTWPDRATAHAEVFAFVETFYNRCRLRKHKVFEATSPRSRPGSGINTPSRHGYHVSSITGKLHDHEQIQSRQEHRHTQHRQDHRGVAPAHVRAPSLGERTTPLLDA
ncbi:hypothetical protein ACFV42_35535 [Streptomyces solisilvae]|uniref:hypothetical protein n=1 Tax=Streptomyces malaysiensis TaxID=92644 RepID=UPI00369513EF